MRHKLRRMQRTGTIVPQREMRGAGKESERRVKGLHKSTSLYILITYVVHARDFGEHAEKRRTDEKKENKKYRRKAATSKTMYSIKITTIEQKREN